MEVFVEIPSDVEVNIGDRTVSVSGKNGSIERDFDDPRFNHVITIEKQDRKISIRSGEDNRKVKSMVGTICAHISNMVTGVSKGYRYELKVVYMHFPITVSVEKNRVHVKNFLGEKGSRTARIIGDTKVAVEKDIVSVTGADIEPVSQTAANIESACRISKRDRRIFQDGIYISGKHLQTGEKI